MNPYEPNNIPSKIYKANLKENLNNINNKGYSNIYLLFQYPWK